MRFKPGDWVKCKDFEERLRMADGSGSWPAEATAEWKAFLQGHHARLTECPST